MAFYKNFITMSKIIGTISFSVLQYTRKKRAFFLHLYHNKQFLTRCQFSLVNFCVNCTCRVASEAIYCWWSTNGPLTHPLCLSSLREKSPHFRMYCLRHLSWHLNEGRGREGHRLVGHALHRLCLVLPPKITALHCMHSMRSMHM
jgi:hypothetical protein